MNAIAEYYCRVSHKVYHVELQVFSKLRIELTEVVSIVVKEDLQHIQRVN